MPRKHRPAAHNSGEIGTAKAARPAFQVLLIDDDRELRETLAQCDSRTCPIEIVQAASLAEARPVLSRGDVDLAVINADLPDGSGLSLADELRRARRSMQTIVVTKRPTLEDAVQAIRAGASDYLAKPVAAKDVTQRLRTALRRQHRERRHVGRVRRLRRLCKKLDEARQEVSQQVDILCSDLVTAYQELATQVQQAAQTGEYSVLVRDELNLEHLLRKTLEYVVQKSGPTNAAVFLPAAMDEFSLGGYVNYDCTPESADMLLQHLADVMAPKIAASEDGLIHVVDNHAMDQWIGDDAAWLSDSHVLAFAAREDRETLAVMALFRDGEEPFSDEVVATCRAIAPMLGEGLAKLIRIHHRHEPDLFKDGGEAV